MHKTYRKGAVGALMDEYERAINELAQLVLRLTDSEFEALRDRQTQDDECRSVQKVVNHVVRAGYGHAAYIRRAFGAALNRPEIKLGSRAESVEQLGAMRSYTEATLEGHWEMTDEEISGVEILSGWGSKYDLEQMLEHGIVHVLRHRRQIERFLVDPQFAASGTAD